MINFSGFDFMIRVISLHSHSLGCCYSINVYIDLKITILNHEFFFSSRVQYINNKYRHKKKIYIAFGLVATKLEEKKYQFVTFMLYERRMQSINMQVNI